MAQGLPSTGAGVPVGVGHAADDLLIELCCGRELVLGVLGVVAQHGAVEELGVGAVGAVPGMAAVSPGQFEGEGGEEVVKGPGDDDVVVEADVDGDEDHGVAHACVGAARGQAGASPGPAPEPLTSPGAPAPTMAPPDPLRPSSSAAPPVCPGNPPALRLSALSRPCSSSAAHQAGRSARPFLPPGSRQSVSTGVAGGTGEGASGSLTPGRSNREAG